jgi:hypothetical protein
MATPNTTYLAPSESGDEVDDADLPSGHVWVYPWKLPSCPNYGKSWRLRSNFVLHFQEREAHMSIVTTPFGDRHGARRGNAYRISSITQNAVTYMG